MLQRSASFWQLEKLIWPRLAAHGRKFCAVTFAQAKGAALAFGSHRGKLLWNEHARYDAADTQRICRRWQVSWLWHPAGTDGRTSHATRFKVILPRGGETAKQVVERRSKLEACNSKYVSERAGSARTCVYMCCCSCLIFRSQVDGINLSRINTKSTIRNFLCSFSFHVQHKTFFQTKIESSSSQESIGVSVSIRGRKIREFVTRDARDFAQSGSS